MSIGELVGIGVGLLSLFSAAVYAGIAWGKLSAIVTKVERVEESAQRLGERVGTLEQRAAVADHELSRPHRIGGE